MWDKKKSKGTSVTVITPYYEEKIKNLEFLVEKLDLILEEFLLIRLKEYEYIGALYNVVVVVRVYGRRRF